MKRILILLIHYYQRFISPLTPPSCRFIPTCSAYGAEAIEKYGAVRGSFMTLKRVLRCNPWNPGGYDPVPVINTKVRKIKLIDYKAIKNNEKK